VKGKTVHCLHPSAPPRTITFDPTEYCYKLALLKNDYQVLNIGFERCWTSYVLCFSLYLSKPKAPLDPLAYLTAKTNGLDDLAAEILEAACNYVLTFPTLIVPVDKA
jgi:hypothetical protein